MTKRVGVALSGGADSAIAASLLLSQGFRVLGVHLLMTRSHESDQRAEHARHIASSLGVGFEVVDIAEAFESTVITPFCREYAAGRTPNPCVTCNREIKFGLLLRTLLSRGVDLLATGHYARITAEGDRHLLQRAIDRRADQSYFLYSLPASILPRLTMPLGTISRGGVRAMALQQGLATAKSSQDICFVGAQDYRTFVARRVQATPGDIVDTQGVMVGHHRGLPYYTVGQRHGLGIALGEPKYVIHLDARLNRIVVGDAISLIAEAATLHHLTWLVEPPEGSEVLVHARTRYRARSTAAQVTLRSEEALVRFEEPQRAVAPGQSVVFYHGDTIIGGGTIAQAHREAEDAEGDSSADQL